MEGFTSVNDELSYHLPISHIRFIKPVRDKYPTAFIIHYMDDILLPMESELCLQQLYDEVTKSSKSWPACCAR